MNTKMNPKYCSTCKLSKYVDTRYGKRLHCYHRAAFGQNGTISIHAQFANECLAYDPERICDALTSRHVYTVNMNKCGIPLSEEKGGVLREVRLR